MIKFAKALKSRVLSLLFFNMKNEKMEKNYKILKKPKKKFKKEINKKTKKYIYKLEKECVFKK